MWFLVYTIVASILLKNGNADIYVSLKDRRYSGRMLICPLSVGTFVTPVVLIIQLCACVMTQEKASSICSDNLEPDQLQYVESDQKDAVARLYGETFEAWDQKPKIVKDYVPGTAEMMSRLSNSQYLPRSPDELNNPHIPHYLEHSPPVMYASRNQPAVIHCVAEPVIFLSVVCGSDHFRRTGNVHQTVLRTYLVHTSPPDSGPIKFGFSNSSKTPNTQTDRRAHGKNLSDVVSVTDVRCGTAANPCENSSNTDFVKEIVFRKEASRVITAGYVEHWFGDYWCQCEAWNNLIEYGEPRVAISPRTFVQLAYIGKRFAKHPTSTRTSLGRSVVFVCEAPEGRPIPVIYWLKNGERLGGSAPDQLREINHTMQDSPSHHSEVSSIDRGVSKIDDRSEQEHNASSRLTIPAVQLGHEGTYVCVAENQAGRRFSHPAHLTIHADGAWSTWSAWSECPPECSPNKQYRKFDEQQQPVGNRFQFCPLFCQKFHSQRWRECNTPKPRGGGRACPGDLTQIASCLEICKKNVFDSPSDTHNSQMSAAEVTLLVGLVIAILIFLGAASVVVYVLTNRWSRNGFHFEKNESLVTCCPIVRLPKFTKPRHLQQPRSAEPPSTFCELKSNSLAQSELSLKTYRFNKRRMSDMNQPCQVIHLSDFANNNVRHAQGCHSDPDWRNSVPPAGYYYCEPKNLWPTAPGQNSQSQFPARSNIFMMYTPQNHPLCANPTNVIYSLPVPAPPREFDNGYGLGKPIESQSYVYIKNPLCESDVPKNAIAGEFSSW